MHKQHARIDCSVHDCAEKRWKLVLLINREWSVTCPFVNWADVISAADDKHAELEQAGWTPMAAVEGVFYDRSRIQPAPETRSGNSMSGSVEAAGNDSGNRLTSSVEQPADLPAPTSRHLSPTMKLRSS